VGLGIIVYTGVIETAVWSTQFDDGPLETAVEGYRNLGFALSGLSCESGTSPCKMHAVNVWRILQGGVHRKRRSRLGLPQHLVGESELARPLYVSLSVSYVYSVYLTGRGACNVYTGCA
jgi:hypothetical protein